jgi:DNA-binding CsgD family transcriptional regulator
VPADTTTTDLRPPTASELRVIRLVAEGKTNKEVASALFLTEDTVKMHLRRLFAAWSVGTRIELIRVAVRNGWVECPDCGPGAVSPAVLREASAALRSHATRLDMLAARIDGNQGGNEAVPRG